MLTIFVLAVLYSDQPQQAAQPQQTQIQQIAESGRCVNAGEKPDERVTPPRVIAPGSPPILSFRLYEGKRHGRFNNSELMLDDAGH